MFLTSSGTLMQMSCPTQWHTEIKVNATGLRSEKHPAFVLNLYTVRRHVANYLLLTRFWDVTHGLEVGKV